MKAILDFLTELSHNNNREWFEENKSRYKKLQADFNVFVERLLTAVQQFDPATRDLQVKDCTYRIYRDVRFSKNKLPYKTHMGAYICPGGKKSGNGGYYFHIQPIAENGEALYFMSTGVYMPEPKVLKSLRDEIFDNGEEFIRLMKKASGFKLGQENKLKRTPTGYPADSPMDEYLKLKDIYLERTFDEKTVLREDLAEWAAAEFKKTYEFNALLNKAVDFAREEL